MIEDANNLTAFRIQLNAELLSSIQAENVQAINGPLDLAEHSADGRLIAGLASFTSYGWLHVQMIWVAEEFRNKGKARQLLEQAFQLAKERSCHSVWLDTSSQKAHQFWLQLGFFEFGRLENDNNQFPKDHKRWFLQKSLL